jgi:hypothetical protein
MRARRGSATVRTMLTRTATETLERLAEDLGAAAWLLPHDDELRGYLVMLASLPAEHEAWLEVLEPWADDLRRGAGPRLEDRGELAAAGAVGVSALRASRDLPHDAPLAVALRAVARWCFFLVRPDAH